LQAEHGQLANLHQDHHDRQAKKEEIARRIKELTNSKTLAQEKLSHTHNQKEEQSKAQ
jgi:hypothetical protein